MNRKLCAILAADVAGYSRLMREDEAKTLADLRRLRSELFDPLVERHRGTIIKRMGDGWLVEFATTVDAVACTIQVQRGLQNDPRIRLRTGIHIGDVIHEGEDIFGDGVNIAARLQDAIEPGGIAISSSVFHTITGTIHEQFEDAGAFALKNIPGRQTIYTWNGRVRLPSDGSYAPEMKAPASIIVLPFATAAENPDVTSFGQGLTDTLITGLSRFSWFLTLPANTSRSYAGRSVSVAELRRELGVFYVVEGALRAAGNRVRVHVELLEAEAGTQIWSGSFDGTMDDPFEMEDRISRSLISELLPRLLGAEARRAEFAARGSPWDLVMRGRQLLWHVNEKDVRAAQALFREAMALSPETGVGQCDLAWCFIYQRIFGWARDLDEVTRLARVTADAALQKDPNDAFALASASLARLLCAEADDGIAFAERAIQANPHLAVGFAGMSLGFFQKAMYSDAMRFGDRALELGPRDPLLSMIRAARGMYFFMLDNDAELEANARALIRDFPGMPTGHRQLAVAHCKSGRIGEARDVVEKDILRLLPEHTATASGRQIPFGKNEDARRKWVELLVAAGLPR